MQEKQHVIGIIGGMGPYASYDLAEKIFEQTLAEPEPGQTNADHLHLPVALLSYPERIPDRSTFLFDPSQPSPVPALTRIAQQLEQVGAVVAGMPCNTAHAPPIYDAVEAALQESGHRLRLVHMIEETARFVKENLPGVRCVGILSTTAVYKLRLYAGTLERHGLKAVVSDEEVQESVVNRTIFDTEYGLKAQSHPVSPLARRSLLDAIGHLRKKGAEAVVLGCTELPLAVPEAEYEGVTLIDPTVVLARALIRETYPEKLRPL